MILIAKRNRESNKAVKKSTKRAKERLINDQCKKTLKENIKCKTEEDLLKEGNTNDS